MLSSFPVTAGTLFVLSVVLAYSLLRLRCRGVGPPFGPRARWWAVTIIVIAAIVSTGLGLALAAISHLTAVAYVSLVVPGTLWFSKLPPQRDRDLLPRTPASWLTLPFSRLYERMGDDMQEWCDIRLGAASGRPQWIADAASYYYMQVQRRLKDSQSRALLDGWRESIAHKIGIVLLIDLDTTPARLRATLQAHPSTQHMRKYNDGDLPQLARRLENDALNELHLLLAYIYRLGYGKWLLIYPFRPTSPTSSGIGKTVKEAHSSGRDTYKGP